MSARFRPQAVASLRRVVARHTTPVSSCKLVTQSQRGVKGGRNVEPLDPRKFEEALSTSDTKQAPSIRVGGGGLHIEGLSEEDSAMQNVPWAQSDIAAERPPPGYIMIDGVFDGAFQVDNEKYNHSLLCLPQFVVQWSPRQLDDITPESLALVCAHYPAIRHLFIGVGYTVPCPTKPEWVEYLNQYRVTCEIMTISQAMRLFNMQNTMFQNFACALLWEPHVTNRLYSLARKIDLGMEDPGDPSAHKRASYYYDK